MSSVGRTSDLKHILNRQDADGVGQFYDVREFRHITVSVASANSADLTLKCQGSITKAPGDIGVAPDFSAAAEIENQWDYVGMYDYQDASLVEGDTGVVLTGTDEVRNLTVNVDGLNFINFEVSGYTAGDITTTCQPYSNN